MTSQISTLRSPRFAKTAVAALAVALGAIALSAAPAQARDEFENGFEDQIGRLLAFEAYRVGSVILGGGYPYAGYYGGYARPRYEEHHHYYPPQRRHYRPRHIHHHYHSRDCGHVEYRTEVRRGRHDDGDRDYERSRGYRDRHDRHDESGYWRDRGRGWRY